MRELISWYRWRGLPVVRGAPLEDKPRQLAVGKPLEARRQASSTQAHRLSSKMRT